MDPGFFAPLDPAEIEQAVADACARATDYEGVMDAARRAHREQVFRIGVQLMGAIADATQAGPAFTAIADACIRALAPAARTETTRLGGAFPGEVAILALGKCGSAEMTATSDLDLMVVYGGHEEGAASEGKGWWAETFWGRFTQRLVSALSAPTGEGPLYEVDLKLRPNGADGPVAASDKAFADYYASEAETWEMLSLTRARVVWASSQAFEDRVAALVEAALRRPRDRQAAARDVREMRKLMEDERPAKGLWDVKLARGGLVDIEFVAQFLQIVAAAEGGTLGQPHRAGLGRLRGRRSC